MKSYVTESVKRTFENHVLEPHLISDHLQAWYLKPSGKTRLQSCLILFTVEGIVIMGDLTPCQNGAISTIGYGVGWFSGHLSEDYLCEKFLTKEFVPELAQQSFKENLLQYRRDGEIDKDEARSAWDDLESKHDELSVDAFCSLYWETFDDTPECGYGYNPGDAALLCGIQQKFSELYQAL